MRARPTSEGLAAGLLTIALMVVALVSGNNLLYLVVGVLVSLWVMELIWGTWNLRGVDAVRRLPDEICADTDAVGRLVVRNRRRWLPVVDVRVLDDGTPAETRVPEIPPGSTAGGVAVWRFGRRGLVPLRTLQLKSRFPFGWLERRLVLPAPAEVVVYPRLTAATGAPSPGQDPGVQREAQATRGGGGDFQGLRTYQAGDRLGAVHWPTSARVGELMVVQRGGEAEPALRVVVTATPPDAWELEIARAAGEVHRGFTRGWRVGLEVPSAFGTAGSRWPSRGGAAWRRSLLEALSMLPEAP